MPTIFHNELFPGVVVSIEGAGGWKQTGNGVDSATERRNNKETLGIEKTRLWFSRTGWRDMYEKMLKYLVGFYFEFFTFLMVNRLYHLYPGVRVRQHYLYCWWHAAPTQIHIIFKTDLTYQVLLSVRVLHVHFNVFWSNSAGLSSYRQ